MTSPLFSLIVQRMDNLFISSWESIQQTIAAGRNDWGSLHPVIVHVPVALLFIAPLFILMGLVFQKSSKAFYISALILLLAGTFGIYLAASTGEHASEYLKPNPETLKTLELHDRLGGIMRIDFTVLTSTFLTYLLSLSFLGRKFGPQTHRLALILFLIIYACHLVLLFNTAHQGGKLVHLHGITSQLYKNIDSTVIHSE